MHLVYIAGWCNGSTPGSLPGDSVRIGARYHIAFSKHADKAHKLRPIDFRYRFIYIFGSDSMTYNFGLCQMLEQNIADEAEAREGYYKLFECYNYDFSEREREQLREIIAEEIKHTEILEAMIYRRNGIVGEQ